MVPRESVMGRDVNNAFDVDFERWVPCENEWRKMSL